MARMSRRCARGVLATCGRGTRRVGRVQHSREAPLQSLRPKHASTLSHRPRRAVDLALSPDGRRSRSCDSRGRSHAVDRGRLGRRRRDRLTGTEKAMSPFWSPDSRSIGFFADGKLKTIASAGGVPQVIADAPDSRGGSWGDGQIVFAPQLDGPLHRVPASGGQQTAVTVLDTSRQEASHRLPSFLPDGRRFLFLAQSGRPENNVVLIGSVNSGERTVEIFCASKAADQSPVSSVFGREQSLLARPLTLPHLQLSGEPAPLGDQVTSRSAVYGDGLFSVAGDGTLAYWNGGPSVTKLTWFGRGGETLGTVGKSGDYLSVALSSDEKKSPSSSWTLLARLVIFGRLIPTRNQRAAHDRPWLGFRPPVVARRNGRRFRLDSRWSPKSLSNSHSRQWNRPALPVNFDALGPSDWSAKTGQIVLRKNMTNIQSGRRRCVEGGVAEPGVSECVRRSRWTAVSRRSLARAAPGTNPARGTWTSAPFRRAIESGAFRPKVVRAQCGGGMAKSCSTWRRIKRSWRPVTADTQFTAGVPTPMLRCTRSQSPRRNHGGSTLSRQGRPLSREHSRRARRSNPVTVVLNWPAAVKK